MRPKSQMRFLLRVTAASVAGALALVYGAELWCRWLAREPDKAAFIAGLREKDQSVWPAVTPQIILSETHFAGLTGPGRGPLLPLGGVAHAPTVFCREGLGKYLEYVSDRHGFHNPDSVWDLPALAVAVVGDSFTQGACVPTDKNLVARLREKIPATVNLGSFGNGPLAELATIREYLPEKKPKQVLWLYVSNDLATDLPIERESQVFRSYLDPDFSQRLAQRQGEIDSALRAFLAEHLASELANETRSLPARVGEVLGIQDLTDRLRLEIQAAQRPPPPFAPAVADYDRYRALDWHLFKRIMKQADQTVKSWGGQLTFVIVPDSRMFGGYAPGALGRPPDQYTEELRHVVESVGIPVANLFVDFAALREPMRYYTPMGGYYGHFNEDGYAFAANAIMTHVLAHSLSL